MNSTRREGRALAGIVRTAWSVLCVAAWGAVSEAEETRAQAAADAAPACVAATVDGVDIYAAEVDRHVQRVLGDRDVDAATRHRAQAAALEQLVRQQLVLAALQQRGAACSRQELEVAVARFTDQLRRQDQTLDTYCRARGIPVAAWERSMRWELSWRAYLEKALTDENLRQHFDDHRADFDGTKMRVAQILLACSDDTAQRAAAMAQAQAIRDDILAGRTSFAAAARQYSQSPSARAGGELAWIARHEPMPEFFARAAFQLQAGEISSPVLSPLGVHLIQCLEIEPGQKSWPDVRGALAASLTEHLFESHVAQAQTQCNVTYTGAVAHYQPGTRIVVGPRHDVHPAQQ